MSSDRARREQQQKRAIGKAIRRLVRAYRASSREVERRAQARSDFIQPVQVFTEDGRQHTLLSRDVSATGIRLIGTRRLLGQKIRLLIPNPEAPADRPADEGCSFIVRILWTCAIGEDLFENGGVFLELAQPPEGGCDSSAAPLT
jgi:hypothetical protein